MLKHITAVALLGLTLAAPAAAQTARQGAHPIKPKLLQQRIRAGVRAGQITPQERAALRQQLQSFRQQLQAMRANGKLTPEQRRTMKQEWRKISRDVFRARHK
jgi:uncharacterized membrane protein